MDGESFFIQAFVYLSAAVIAVPFAQRFGLGSVLGYLIAGMVIGPSFMGLIGEEGKDVMHFAEFGVVMMLFVVGLELEPSLLWRMRVPILGMGGAQVSLTAVVVAAFGLALGLGWREAVAVGLILALSSTAIVLQTLNEKGLMQTTAGRSSFAVLLFQDIAVIPMFALFPLLADPAASHGDGDHGSLIAGLPAWLQGLAVIGAVGAVVFGGRFLTVPAFRAIARTRTRELFVAASLLLIIGIALLMKMVGLSPALGTFVAGVVLAESEYRHELESDIEPFKGVLLGLFFIAVGASVDFNLIQEAPMTIAGLVAGLVVAKLLVLLALGRGFGLSLDQNLIFSFALAQGGEFAFVLFTFAAQNGVLRPSSTAPLMASVAVSMALTPVLMLLFDRVIRPRVGTKEKPSRAFDQPEAGRVIIAGFGRFGQIASRLLDMEGIPATILEADSDQVDLLRRFGRKVYYGDASRYDLLEVAGARQADLLILAIDNPEKTIEMVQTVHKHFPQLKIMARARSRTDAYELLHMGVDHVYRETFDSALRMGEDALGVLGFRAHHAYRAGRRFRRRDEALMRELAGMHKTDTENFISIVRRQTVELEDVMRRDRQAEQRPSEEGWDAKSIADDRSLATPRK